MTKVFEIDPRGAIQAFSTMMRKNIAMPGGAMDDGKDHQIFSRYARVAQNIGVYTISDYADIIRDLVRHWRIETLQGLSDQAAQAQDYLCSLPDRYDRLAQRVIQREAEAFSWILDREPVPAR
jgi:acyl-[acyl-carrier-protein] desaturase